MDLLTLRQPHFGFEPGGGLPRRYPYWRDAGFWLTLVWIAPVVYCLIRLVHLSMLQHAAWWILLLLALVLLSHPAVVFWMLWDSWRWDLPHRGAIVLWAAISGPLWVFWYFFFRQGWVMDAQREARLHKLGLWH